MMTKRPAEKKLGINQRELSLSFGNHYGEENANELYNMHSFYLALCWVSKVVPCCNAVMFLSCIPLRDAFGLSVVVLYLLIFSTKHGLSSWHGEGYFTTGL